jgi:hypothetical protein
MPPCGADVVQVLEIGWVVSIGEIDQFCTFALRVGRRIGSGGRWRRRWDFRLMRPRQPGFSGPRAAR